MIAVLLTKKKCSEVVMKSVGALHVLFKKIKKN